MGRRRIPLAILATLSVLTVLFALLALHMAPSGASLTVQNATAATYGSPAGTQSLSLSLRSVTTGTASDTTLRFLNFAPPAHMTVYQTVPTASRFGAFTENTALSLLNSFAAMPGGATTWVQHGSLFTRTESLAAFQQRIDEQQHSHAQIVETAVVEQGYLVAFRYKIVVAGQTQSVVTVHLLRINGNNAPAVSS